MYKILQSIKYNGQYYRKGQQTKLSDKDLSYLSSKGFIGDYRGDSYSSNVIDKVEDEKPLEANTEAMDYSKMNKTELQILATNKGIDYKEQDTKKELIKKLARG